MMPDGGRARSQEVKLGVWVGALSITVSELIRHWACSWGCWPSAWAIPSPIRSLTIAVDATVDVPAAHAIANETERRRLADELRFRRVAAHVEASR